jgi:CRISPR-associated protein Csh2
MTNPYLPNRREILFLYDIRMGNPNGDPNENRPRRLPDGKIYVTDVRLKRFARDYAELQNKPILVGNIEGRTTNLTGRVADYLKQKNQAKANGEELVNIILDSFVDARWFGSSLAFKAQNEWKPEPIPKTLTGAVQFNMGEVLHEVEEIITQGTTTFGSEEGKTQGTFTEVAGLRYGLIAFSGVANQYSAQKSRMSEADYDFLLKALWNGVREANTRSKTGQVPRLLISLEYKESEEFQFGNLLDYVKLQSRNNKPQKEWVSPLEDYQVDTSILLNRLTQQAGRIDKIRYEASPDMLFEPGIPATWQALGFDK